MSGSAPPVDADAVMRVVNPSPEPPSGEAMETALRRVLAEREQPADARRFRRMPRVRLVTGGLVVAAFAAFAVLTLLPASTSPAGVNRAWAKDVLARAAAVTRGSGHGIMHIDALVLETTPNHAIDTRYRVESWAQLRAPRDFWEVITSGSDHTTTTVAGSRIETYDSSTNTLTGATKQISGQQPRAALFDPAYHAVLAVLYPNADPVSSRIPGSLSGLIARVIRSPRVKVDRNASYHGERAIRITALSGRAVLYLQPRGYVPLEFATKGDPGAAPQNVATVRMRFRAYGVLPDASASPPNLPHLHPTAKLAS